MMSKKRRNRNNTSSTVASEKVDIVKEDIIASDEIDVATSSEVANEEVDESSVVSVDISKDDDEISVVEKFVDAPDETKPNFGASEEPVMAKIVANVPEGESNMVDMNTIEGLNGKGNSCLSYFETEDSELASEDSEDVKHFKDACEDIVDNLEEATEPVNSWFKKLKGAFEPKSNKEPATLGGTLLIILLLIVALIMVINLCSLMGRLPVQVDEHSSKVEEISPENNVGTEVIDTSKVQTNEITSDVPEKEIEKLPLDEAPEMSDSPVLDEAGNPIIDETEAAMLEGNVDAPMVDETTGELVTP